MEVSQLILNGLMSGTILAVPAIGLTAIFAVLRFTNFALASHMTIGAFAGFVANVTFGVAGRAVAAGRVHGGGPGRRGDRRVRAEAVPGRRLHHHRHRLDRAHHRARELRALRLRQRAAGLRPADPARLGDRRPARRATAGGEPRHRRDRHGAAVCLPLLHPHRQGDARGRRQSHARLHQGHQCRHGGAPRLVRRHGPCRPRRHADRPRHHHRSADRLQDHPVDLRRRRGRRSRQPSRRRHRRAGGRRRRGAEPARSCRRPTAAPSAFSPSCWC